MEVRTVQANQFRANKTANNQLHVSGYVNKTGQKSDPIPNMGEVPTDSDIPDNEPDQFVEIIQPGVFTDALQNADFVDFLYEHEPDKYLASTREGTLQLSEDNIGLKMSADIQPTSWGKDAFTLIKSGAIAGMSFGFIVLDDNWDLSGQMPVRTVTKLQLFEVSAVRFPAYPSSTIEARRKYMKRLNAKLEKRGFTIPRVTINKNRGNNMYTNKFTKRAANGNASTTLGSADINNLVNAIGNLSNSIDNNTNAVQTNSEVQSNIADQIMQAANAERSKTTKHSKVSKNAKKMSGMKMDAKKRAGKVGRPKKRDDSDADATASDVASDESAEESDNDEDDLDTDAKKRAAKKRAAKAKKRAGKVGRPKKRGDTDVDEDAKPGRPKKRADVASDDDEEKDEHVNTSSKKRTTAKSRAGKKGKSGKRSKVSAMMADLDAMSKA